MKIDKKIENTPFRPVTLTIKLETEKEYNMFTSIFAYPVALTELLLQGKMLNKHQVIAYEDMIQDLYWELNK